MTMVLEVYILRYDLVLFFYIAHKIDLKLSMPKKSDFQIMFSRKTFPKHLVYSVMIIVLGAMVAAW